jgi:hypothetical protein
VKKEKKSAKEKWKKIGQRRREKNRSHEQTTSYIRRKTEVGVLLGAGDPSAGWGLGPVRCGRSVGQAGGSGTA